MDYENYYERYERFDDSDLYLTESATDLEQDLRCPQCGGRGCDYCYMLER